MSFYILFVNATLAKKIVFFFKSVSCQITIIEDQFLTILIGQFESTIVFNLVTSKLEVAVPISEQSA